MSADIETDSFEKRIPVWAAKSSNTKELCRKNAEIMSESLPDSDIFFVAL